MRNVNRRMAEFVGTLLERLVFIHLPVSLSNAHNAAA